MCTLWYGKFFCSVCTLWSRLWEPGQKDVCVVVNIWSSKTKSCPPLHPHNPSSHPVNTSVTHAPLPPLYGGYGLFLVALNQPMRSQHVFVGYVNSFSFQNFGLIGLLSIFNLEWSAAADGLFVMVVTVFCLGKPLGWLFSQPNRVFYHTKVKVW